MKKFLNYGLALLAVALTSPALVSCDDDDDVKSYNLAVEVILPEGISLSDISDLTAVATKGKKEVTVPLTQLSGVAEVPQGTYSVSVTGKISETSSVQGAATIDVFEDAAVKVQLGVVSVSPLVFKEIYTAANNWYTQDTYFEIVNNSDEVQYLDQLVLLSSDGSQKTANAWQASGVTDIYYQAQGPVVAFPGSGTDYPIQPGQSVVIANDATNHNEADPAPAGEDPYHSDLSTADWEIYLDYSKMGDVDYKAPNLYPIFYNNEYMRAWGMGFYSGVFILAKLPAGVTPEAYAADEKNFSTEPNTTSSTLYMGIPSAYVLDAVEAWDRTEADHYPTLLPKDDAHAVWAAEGWAGKAIRRKVAKIENGRPYYKDTNNSFEDFLTDQPQKPGVTPTTVDE